MLFPEREFTGYDLSKNLIELCEIRAKRLKLRNVNFLKADHDNINLKNKDTIYTSDIVNEHNFIKQSKSNKEYLSVHNKLANLRKERMKKFCGMLNSNGVFSFIAAMPSFDNSPFERGSSLLEDCIYDNLTDFYEPEKSGFKLDSWREIGSSLNSTIVLVFMRKSKYG